MKFISNKKTKKLRKVRDICAAFHKKLFAELGVVEYKDYDKNNHNNPTIYFTNGNSMIEGDFWSVIKKGDSLIKKKGEYIIRVYRNDSMFTLNQKEALQDYQKNKN